MTSARQEVFLTGATGFLGHYLLAAVLSSERVRCRVLLRSPLATGVKRLAGLLGDLGLDLDALIAAGRIVPVEGALPEPLSAAALRGVDLVLHAAGNTIFHANGSGEPYRSNVEGTRRLLALADQAGVARFVLVSTAYVCGARAGRMREVIEFAQPPARNDYERSKWQAERMVWDWATPPRVATVCRPSILFGDRGTGRATVMKGLYLIARAAEILSRAVDGSAEIDRHRIPLRILGRGDATCNVVPVDWAAERIASLALAPASRSSVHHVTNPDPPTHEEVKHWLENCLDIAGGRFCDAEWPLEDPNHYEELFYSLGNICLDYFRHGLAFESHSPDDKGRDEGGPRLVDGPSFARCLRYAQSARWRGIATRDDRPVRRGERVDPDWYFREFLSYAVPRSRVARVEALTATVRYTITGEPGGSWVNRYVEGKLCDTRRDSSGLATEFEYRLTHEDFESVVTCRRPLQDVFFNGSAEMFGDIERALKMVPIIGAFLGEYPVQPGRDSE